MTLPAIHIEKSRIPIIWLDTSVITNMTIFRQAPNKLEETQRKRIEQLYKYVYEYGRAGRIICPLAEQEGEVWIKRDDWMDTIRELSLGIECVGIKEIQDSQVHKAMKAYVNNESSINLSYLDAFHRDPVQELERVIKQPYFITTNYDIIFGADYRRESNKKLVRVLNEQREKNVASGKSFDDQLPEEMEGEIQAIVKMAQELAEGIVQNERDEFNKFGAMISLGHQLLVWEEITGKAGDIEGLISFHRSEYNKKCPYMQLSCNLFARVMTDPQPIKPGDPMDITHISTLMPYSDLFITDKHWSTFLNKQKFDERYRAKICYVGDTNEIENFFDEVP